MTTMPQARPPVNGKPRKPRVLKPLAVAVCGVPSDRATGRGTVYINGKMYVLEAVRDRGRTVGLAFGKLDATDRWHHVDFTVAPWSCDCEDAIFNSTRPGGCKHTIAARRTAQQLRD